MYCTGTCNIYKMYNKILYVHVHVYVCNIYKNVDI